VKLRRYGVSVLGFIAALAATLALPGSALAVNASSTFTSGNDSWNTAGTDCVNAAVPATFSPSGGNPGGYISGTDTEGGMAGQDECAWAFVAPAAFSGDMRANYGGTLSYDLRTAASDSQFGGGFAIRSADGSGIQVVGGTPPPMAGVWSPYQFTLTVDDPAAIYFDSNQEATQPPTLAQYFSVLSNVSSVALLGDLNFESQGETTNIDNVQLFEAMPPEDSDGDGLTNASDNCPAAAGPASNNGCPVPVQDSDGDGVPNAQDNCPAVAGPASNGGCPVATNTDCADAKAALKKAKKKLRKLIKNDAPARKIKKAKKRVKRAKKRVAAACDGTLLAAPAGPSLLTAP
jgi:hypothetical protein